MSLQKYFLALLVFSAFWIAAIYATISVVLAQEDNSDRSQLQQSVERVWETSPDLMAPESVLYYPDDDILIISNVNGDPGEKDQNGFISKVSVDNGSIIELNWINGLNAPKGLAINDGKLYISDIDELVEADVSDGQITNRYHAAGAAFLNDVAIDSQDRVYVTDTGTNTIYRLENSSENLQKANQSQTLDAWLASDDLDGPNGLYVDNNNSKIIVASFGNMSQPGGTLKVVDILNKTIRNLGNEQASPVGGLDGVDFDAARNSYYVSDWPSGKVYAVSSNGTGYAELIDLQTQGTADLMFIAGKNMLLVPLMQDNKLIAYKILSTN